MLYYYTHYTSSVLKSTGFIKGTLTIHNSMTHAVHPIFSTMQLTMQSPPVEHWSCPNGKKKLVKKPQAELFLLDLSEQIFSNMDDDGSPLTCAAEWQGSSSSIGAMPGSGVGVGGVLAQLNLLLLIL